MTDHGDKSKLGSKLKLESTQAPVQFTIQDEVFDAVLFTDFLRSKGVISVAEIVGDHCDKITITDTHHGRKFIIECKQCHTGLPISIEKSAVTQNRSGSRIMALKTRDRSMSLPRSKTDYM